MICRNKTYRRRYLLEQEKAKLTKAMLVVMTRLSAEARRLGITLDEALRLAKEQS